MTGARWLESDALENHDLSSAHEIGSYTADADRLVAVQLLLDTVAGSGDYIWYATLQVGGSGSAYVFLPKTTAAAAAGETAIGGQSLLIGVRDDDVLKVYVDCLAADSSVDAIVRFFEVSALQPATAERTLVVDAAGLADANAVKVGPTGSGTAQTAGDICGKIGTPADLGGGASLAQNLSDIEGQTDDIGAAGAGLTVLATAAELAKVPKSDSNVSWNATALGAINAEVDGALNTAIPGSPTADSINERIVAIDAYGTPPTAATIADAVWDEASTGHTDAGKAGAQLWTDIDAIAVDVAGLDGAAMRGTDGAYTGTPPSSADIKTALEIDGGKLDHLWEMTEDDGGVRRLTTNALEQAPSGALTAEAVADAVLDEAKGTHTGFLTTLALEATLTAIKGAGWTTETLVAIDVLLDAIKLKADYIGAATVTVSSPVATSGAITVIRGDDYLRVDGRELSFTGTSWPVITAGALALIVYFAAVTTFTGVVTGAPAGYVELSDTQTAAMTPGGYDYDLQATLANGSVVTLAQGTFTVIADVR